MIFSKPKETDHGSPIETIIGKDCILIGDLKTSASVRIDGAVKGDLQVGGDLFIGEQCKMEGTLSAKNISVSGTIHGALLAREKVELSQSAVVFANMKTKSLAIAEGAFFEGECLPTTNSEPDSATSDK